MNEYIAQAENSLAGCLLVTPEETIRKVAGIIAAGDFLNDSVRRIYTAAVKRNVIIAMITIGTISLGVRLLRISVSSDPFGAMLISCIISPHYFAFYNHFIIDNAHYKELQQKNRELMSRSCYQVAY